MPCRRRGKKHRKHTPIVSEAQRGFFGAEYKRRKKGMKGRVPSITRQELKEHLVEAGGKKLPKKIRKRKRGDRYG